jgi:hypothetical protein
LAARQAVFCLLNLRANHGSIGGTKMRRIRISENPPAVSWQTNAYDLLAQIKKREVRKIEQP